MVFEDLGSTKDFVNHSITLYSSANKPPASARCHVSTCACIGLESCSHAYARAINEHKFCSDQ